MRVAAANALGLGQAHQPEQLGDAVPAAGVLLAIVPTENLRDLLADAHAGAQRGRRVLWHQADAVAAQGVQRRPAEAQQINALEDDPPAVDAAARASVPEQVVGDRRLAAAALADQTERLTPRDREADAVDDAQPAVIVVIGDAEVLDLDQSGSRRRRGLTSRPA